VRRGLRAALARLVDARRRGTSLVLLFDYDGTLVPIVEHPSMAVLSTETRYRLEQLASTPSIVIGVVSGRAIDDLRDRVGVEDAYYAGTSGLELSFGSIAIVQAERARAVPLVAAVVMPIRQAISGHAGAWMEQKPLGLTVHYRDVAPGQIDALRADVTDAIGPFSGTLRVVEGAMAIEITPDLGWTKGTALRRIIEHVGGTAVLPLYAGDDTNDADALLEATDLGGVAIGIGPRAPSQARYRLPDPWSLGCVLDVLLDMLVDSSTGESPSWLNS
jgi:trehalose 6-phosphate phosphatase